MYAPFAYVGGGGESYVLGIHNYYRIATNITLDMCSSSKNVSKRSPKRLAPWST